ncbi:biopolymer transport protein ExbB [Chitinophaga ginsengisegetis]|uniref:Biopolymer transport protein ExbB n=1 Tax=Chitinophaga ginsengisegetis TaxID=393003 RepID=A0A1T5NYH2_9BACT|nr:MotA/TolQ/ExbB proton channel family protein [Chitinophaga ginsengisegetis]MDR6567152.1 biopolymer transport protein ExbB [Chitinophaga ginsengisegetis]MDR6646882.1 biopolymer transport protein ExbB [Chitinophaga ginsengisegetis]MDR6653232.1 biopolymer transport protein ExbB [Chitinophaga ginsengisegetis]SKD05482.1 biopolymer transport protein ExbB [Chitinophaga ginsengisegetis]
MLLGFITLLQDSLSSLPADSAALAAGAAGAPAPEIHLIDMLMKGGVLMIPLGILSLIAVYVFVERAITISKAGRLPDNFMPMIRDQITTGNMQSARSLAKNTYGPIARMIEKGIQRIGKPIENIEKSMENVGKLEIYRMEKNLVILSIIAGIAPMFGFLGTIAGMIQTFFNISITSDITLGTIAGGIYVKMITSASGLIIGIVAFIGYSYLNAQIDKVVNKMEGASAEFIDILQEPTR